MQQTPQYNELSEHIHELGKNFLPEKTSPLGEYSQKERQHVRAYCILCHAEFEHYIETIANSVATHNLKLVSNGMHQHRFISNFLAWFILHGDKENIIELQQEMRSKFNKSLDELLSGLVYPKYKKILKQNHGIKEENIKKLLRPLGFDVDLIDQEWLASLHSFGSERGNLVHKSFGAELLLDPVSEKNKIHTILDGFKGIDSELQKIMLHPTA